MFNGRQFNIQHLTFNIPISVRSRWRRLFLPRLRFPAEASRPSNGLLVRSEAHGFRASEGDECLLAPHRRSFALAPVILPFGVEDPALDVVRHGDREDLL